MKKIIYITILLVFVFSLSGCKPQGSPEETLNQYLESLKTSDFETSYSLLSEKDKKTVSKKEFIEFLKASDETFAIKSYKIVGEPTRLVKYEDYKYAYDIKVSAKYMSRSTNKETSSDTNFTIVSEGKQWKFYYADTFHERIALTYNNLGQMYLNGEGKKKDYNKAAEYFKKAIAVDPDLSEPHYYLGVAYLYTNNFKESGEEAQKCIYRSDNSLEQSNAFNLIGTIQEKLGDIELAKQNYSKALKLNPSNTYAKTNLDKLN